MIFTSHFNSLKLSHNLTNDCHWHSNVDHIPSADHWWRKKASVQKINDPSDWIIIGWEENTIFTHKCLKTLDKTQTKYHNNFDKFFDWWDKKMTVLFSYTFHILDGRKKLCIHHTKQRRKKNDSQLWDAPSFDRILILTQIGWFKMKQRTDKIYTKCLLFMNR